MGECLIVSKKASVGGSVGEPFAYIILKYPVGGVCTCIGTSGEFIKAVGTSGLYIFPIPSAGDWVVNCSLNNSDITRAIKITERYQIEEVELTFDSLIFDVNGFHNGYTLDSLTAFFLREVVEGDIHYLSANLSSSEEIALIRPAITPTTKYNYICAEFEIIERGSNWVSRFGSGVRASATSAGEKIDLSTVTGNVVRASLKDTRKITSYVYMQNSRVNINYKKIWLE